MKVLYIGHYLTSQPLVGGNTLYQYSLANEMTKHADISFISTEGLDSNVDPYVRRLKQNKVNLYNIVNSPMLNYTNIDPNLFSDCKQLHVIYKKIINTVKPDIIHIHDIFFPVSIFNDLKIPLITTIHNYVHVCAQHNLMYNGTEKCSDYQSGNKCVQCLSPVFALNKNYFRGIKLQFTASKLKSKVLMGLVRGLMQLTMKRAVFKPSKANANYDVKLAERNSYSPLNYKLRRDLLIRLLNRNTYIQCASEHLMRYLISYGVQSNKLKLIPLTSVTLNKIKPKPYRSKHYPIVFGYFGGFNINKGYEIVLNAFRKLDKDKSRLIMWGHGIGRLTVDDKNITVVKNPESTTITEILKSIDVGLVPSVWDETFGIIGLELNNAKIPIIGSRVGGIPQWLNEGVNGMLVEPGNVDDLSSKMKMFVDSPELIYEFQTTIRPWKLMNEHGFELFSLYREAIEKYSYDKLYEEVAQA